MRAETREGEVYARLLEKLEEEREALGGQVFDVLGKADLRATSPCAICWSRRSATATCRRCVLVLPQVVDDALDHERLVALLDERALARDTLDARMVQRIRADMERAEARRLQPHFIASFFLEAFRLLGGQARMREASRYELTHVPAALRNWTGTTRSESILPRYERITFEKEQIAVQGKPPAAFICPGHPLLDATIAQILERFGDLLRRGAVLVDPADPGESVRVLFSIEHAIQDGRPEASGARRIISRQMQFVEIDAEGMARPAGAAPYLDYRALADAEQPLVAALLEAEWLGRDLEGAAMGYAIGDLVPAHLQEVRGRKDALVARTMAAVQERLTREIIYWDRRATELKAQEEAGKTPRLNSARARGRADELEGRLKRRMDELRQEQHIAALPPAVIGGALVVPGGLLARRMGTRDAPPPAFAHERQRVERLAMDAVMAAERRLGNEPRDVGAEKLGYDVEARTTEGRLRFIEVKGRVTGAETVTLTKNEILTALNKPDDWLLALVEVPTSVEFAEGDAFYTGIAEEREGYVVAADCPVRYIRRPFTREPDFGATSVNYNLIDLLKRAEVT